MDIVERRDSVVLISALSLIIDSISTCTLFLTKVRNILSLKVKGRIKYMHIKYFTKNHKNVTKATDILSYNTC